MEGWYSIEDARTFDTVPQLRPRVLAWRGLSAEIRKSNAVIGDSRSKSHRPIRSSENEDDTHIIRR